MRTLFLLRGSPASGKSTWIKENHLEPYTLSTDNIRLMVQSPVLNNDGKLIITQQNDNKVWSLLMNMLENRMSRGEFCIIDATHYKWELIKQYKQLIAKYRYRAYVVDFTDVSKDELIKRNSNRDQYKQVPVGAIEKMCSVFEAEKISKQIPGYVKVISKDEAVKKLNEDPIYDFNDYEKVIVIPDLHGCYEPLKSYFENHPFNEKYFYCFLGDYIDRGLQNKEVLEFLISIMDKSNVLLLEGNHEKWLRKYCSKEEKVDLTKGDIELLSKFVSKNDLYEIKNKYKSSHEFEHNTIPQIESVDKSLLRRLCERLGQFAYFKFGNNVYCLTHAGISNKPTLFTSTQEFINGVGKYDDVETIYKAWTNNTPDNYIQLHGHRNVYNIEPIYNDQNINLNSSVEFGDDLRIATISKESVVVEKYKNSIFRKREEKRETIYIQTEDELYKSLNENPMVNKKLLDNDIVSYNFNRNAFKKGIWNKCTVKARGLFINSKTQNVTCRSYSKFFNIEEVEETELRNIKANVEYPLIGYKKENGFLGLVSWDKDNNELFVASKSTNVGEYADLVRKQFYDLNNKESIIAWLKESNCTLVFEVIDIETDPHIIKYDKSKLVLLDAIENKLDGCKKLNYSTLEQLSALWDIECKKQDLRFYNWEDFYKFYNKIKEDKSIHHEGWVFEDKNGFMFKFKTPYYKFWKYMRSIKDLISKGRQIRQTFKDAYEVDIINFMKSIDQIELSKMSIIEVRDRFIKERYFEGPCLEPQEENKND